MGNQIEIPADLCSVVNRADNNRWPYITCSTKLQFERLELKANKEDDEFLSLRRAYKGEKNVSIQEIKKDMIKAIEVIQSKLGTNDRLTDLLSSTRHALMEKANN